MLQIIPDKRLKNNKLIIPITLFISLVAGFLPFGYFLSIQRTLSFMPFFFFGYYMKDNNIFLPDKYKPFCFIFLIFTFLIPLFFSQYLGSLSHANPYGVLGDNIYNRIAVFCICIPMSIAFMNICPKTKWSVQQGKFTMQYYIYHGLIIPPLMMFINKFNFPISLLATTIYTIAIIIGIGIASYFPYFKIITNPLSFLRQK